MKVRLIRLLNHRYNVAQKDEYSKNIFLDAGDYMLDREIKGLGYLVFVNNGKRTIINYKDGVLL